MRGDRLRRIREEIGYTQEELSEMLGIAVLQINRYESNKTKPSSEMLGRIAKVLNVSADYLLGLTDDATPISFASSGLSFKERSVIVAWRQGRRLDAVKMIANDDDVVVAGK